MAAVFVFLVFVVPWRSQKSEQRESKARQGFTSLHLAQLRKPGGMQDSGRSNTLGRQDRLKADFRGLSRHFSWVPNAANAANAARHAAQNELKSSRMTTLEL